MQQWEYAILSAGTNISGRVNVTYTAPHDIADDDHPYQAIDSVIGELGGKGWELVSATEIFRPSDDYWEKTLYFKRAHDDSRELKD